MSRILYGAAALALLAALAAGWGRTAPVPEPGDKDPRSPQQIDEAQRELRSLRRQAERPNPDLEELWTSWQRFRTAYAGTPEWRTACEFMAKAPSPLDKLDREQIPEEDRSPWLPKEVVAVLGENRGRHWGSVWQITVTPDNQVVAASPEGVRLWDAALHERAFFPASHCFTVAEKKRILAIAKDKQIVLWDLSGEKPKEGIAFPNPPDEDVAGVESLAITPDGRTLAVAFRRRKHGNIEVWDLGGDKPRRRRTLPINPRRTEPSAVALSPDGRWLADDGGFGSAPVRLWDLTADEKKPPALLDDTGERPLVFSPDGKLLASGIHSTTGTRLWDLSGGAPKSLRDLHNTPYDSGGVSFSPDGRTLATVSGRQLHLWPMDEDRYKELGLKAGQTYSTFPLSLYAYTVAYFPDGKTLALGCQNAVRLWDLAKSVELYPPRGHVGEIRAMAFSPDGRTLATGGDDHTLRFWNLAGAAAKERAVVKAPGPIYEVQFRADGRTAMALTLDGADSNTSLSRLRAWDVTGDKPKELWALEPHAVDTHDWALSPDGASMATAGIDVREEGYPPGVYNIQLWDFVDGRPVRKGSTGLPPLFKGEENKRYIGFCRPQPFSPDGRLLLCGGGKNDVRLVDVTAKPPSVRWAIHTIASDREESDTLAALFSPDGKTVATAGCVQEVHGAQHGRILLWDISGPGQPKPRATLNVPGENVVENIAFTLDGKRLASVGLGGLLTLLDPDGGRVLGQWQLPGKAKALWFAPDGRHLATANDNGTVYIFRIPLRETRDGGK